MSGASGVMGRRGGWRAGCGRQARSHLWLQQTILRQADLPQQEDDLAELGNHCADIIILIFHDIL